ncbi:hypothetical protein IKF15_02205 [Candidatus Saccharibacteria bacterium]|nr:hypothetical protein [Candidatus Saccharibacteria bacterium]
MNNSGGGTGSIGRAKGEEDFERFVQERNVPGMMEEIRPPQGVSPEEMEIVKGYEANGAGRKERYGEFGGAVSRGYEMAGAIGEAEKGLAESEPGENGMGEVSEIARSEQEAERLIDKVREVKVSEDAERLPKEYMYTVSEGVTKLKEDPHAMVHFMDAARWDLIKKAFGRNKGDGLQGSHGAGNGGGVGGLGGAQGIQGAAELERLFPKSQGKVT